MKSPSFLLLGLLLAACSSNTTSSRAQLLGTTDLVLVDVPAGTTLARNEVRDADGNVVSPRVGLPGGYLFVTSSDSNELRVLEPWRAGRIAPGFAPAPNPLEVLSIPVLDQASLLTADEGRDANGGKVSGAYVYAGRPGAAELSVVSVRDLKALGHMPLPAPLTAMTAWMNVNGGEVLPATTTLYVATWDGAVGSVVRAELSTESATLDEQITAGTVAFSRVLVLDGAPIKALQVIGPRPGRTLDGAPFCDTSVCLALASRKPGGLGTSVLYELSTGRSATLAFGGQVRDLASSSRADGDERIYAVLDEESCGGPQCGGVVSVEVSAGTSAGGFPLTRDVSGQPMVPLRAGDGLITGLTIAAGGVIRGNVEVAIADGGGFSSFSAAQIGYTELGAYASSNGFISFFSGERALLIDVDPRRAELEAAVLREPALLGDGGVAFQEDDGGVLGNQETAVISRDGDFRTVDGARTMPFRSARVTAGGAVWQLEVADGYLASQTVFAVNAGSLPGLIQLGTVAANRLSIPAGLESRVRVGDSVRFFSNAATTECARANVVQVGAGFVDIDQSPGALCPAPVTFTVRAGATQPLVLTAEIEGYLGRADPGETFTYQRRYALAVEGVGPVTIESEGIYAPRPALTLRVPASLPKGEGAYMSLTINAYQAPFRATLDTATIGCYVSSSTIDQLVLGSLTMGYVPVATSTISTEPSYEWYGFAVVPSGNALVRLSMARLSTGRNSTGSANCY